MRGNKFLSDVIDRDLTIRNLRGENTANITNKMVSIFQDRERMDMWKNYFNNFGNAGDEIIG